MHTIAFFGNYVARVHTMQMSLHTTIHAQPIHATTLQPRHGCRPLTRRRRLEALDQLERRLVGDERLREGAGARLAPGAGETWPHS